MKKRLLLPIILSLCFPFLLNSCSEKESPVDELELHQLENGVSSLNPLLTWNGDGSNNYKIEIHNDTLNQYVGIYSDVSSPYSLGGYLDLNTTYTVTVSDKTHTNYSSIGFTTMKEGGSKMDSVSTYLMVYGAYDDNMIIQRDKPFTIKGFAKRGVQVSVMLDEEVYTAISDGDWEITIPAHEASGKGSTIRVIASNKNQITFNDVLFGDVYLVAGQSNIQWPIKDSDYQPDDLNIDSRKVRFFAQATSTCPEHNDNFLDGKWFLYNKNDAGNQFYSAIGLMLGSMLGKELKDNDVPIGIMYAAQGDTNISKWIDFSYYHGEDKESGIYFNSMVYPFKGLNVKGVVWYQGCNDSSKAIQYSENLLDLFSCYRNLFNDSALPFYVIQLPCFDGDSGNSFNFAYVRDAQYKACMQDDNAYLIATCDGGDPTYIHPSQKRYICERLTKSILATTYGYQNMKEGPTVKQIIVKDNEFVISLNNANGLHSDSCKGFVIAGEDGKFHDASARIENEEIIVSSSKVNEPCYIRYGFTRSPFLDIYNEDGYLMSPFRNDEYDKNIDILNYENINLYKKDPSGGDYSLSINNEKLVINKPVSDIGYCAMNLDRWSPVNHTGSKFRLAYKGTNSGAEIQIRFTESSYEIWSFTFIDDSTETVSREVEVSSELKCVYNPIDENFNYEAIMQVGLLIKSNVEVNIEISEARFI